MTKSTDEPTKADELPADVICVIGGFRVRQRDYDDLVQNEFLDTIHMEILYSQLDEKISLKAIV